ncbi:MAG: EsaB/YukD family protein [Corynebacterium sp.]|uniref:EsaB/YukD family protein n=1 Tax=Corynebacterium sp. TaxID=1720 RepID=UPI0026E0C693|nr:EsaB/YukD family protein [Corynebacterium sp.]MDO5669811.1 EsaB/YukD family protein [Corynebacterium sp.]
MAPMFIRLSVVRDDRQLDVSLPAQRPVIDFLDDTIALLNQRDSEPAAPGDTVTHAHTWALSSPLTGTIAPTATLAEHGVTDGQRLYLTPRIDAAHSPFVDDIMAEMRDTVSDTQWSWFGASRSAGLLIAGVILLALLGGAAAAYTLTGPAEWSNTRLIATGVLATLGLTGTALSFWQPQGWLRWAGLSLPLSAAIIALPLLRVLPSAQFWPWWVATIAVTALVVPWATGRRQPGGGLAGATALVLSALLSAAAGVAVIVGASPLALAAWSAWAPVLVLLSAPTLALSSTGLPSLLRRHDSGDAVRREDIRRRTLRTESLSRGLVWAAIAAAAAIIVVLALGPHWQQGLIPALLSLVLLLRTTGFADARIIVPLLIVGIGGLSLSAGAFLSWFVPTPEHWAAWLLSGGLLIVSVIAVLGLQGRTADDLAEARNAKVIGMIDAVVSLAFIPVILIAQGVFTWYWATT